MVFRYLLSDCCGFSEENFEQTNEQKYFFMFAKKNNNFPYSSNILPSPLIRVQERPRYPLLPKTKTAMRAALCA